MGKIKRKAKMLHRKNIKKAKERLHLLDRGKISYNQLNRTSRKMMLKRFNAGYKLPVQQHMPEKSAEKTAEA